MLYKSLKISFAQIVPSENYVIKNFNKSYLIIYK